MARKKNIELGIDLLVNNYTEAAKSLDEISKLTSSFDGITQKNKTHINELKLALQALGKNMPTNELKNFIKANVNISSSIGSINNAFREHQKTIKATEAQYSATIKKVEEYQQKIKELGDITAPVKKSKKAAELLATPAFAQANNLLKQRKVGANAQDPDQAKWTALKTSTDENAKKLVATVNQYVEAQEAARKKLADLTAELNKANAQLKQQETVLTELRNTAQTFEQVQTHVESASEAINENNQAMGQAHSAALKTGEAQISLKKSTDATTTSFGKAARSIFNYTILYQGLKQVLRESIRTIKEMDDAITGMTVVTSLSREQAWEQVEAFQAIAKATSSTMTEIASLTTEYLKQGRALKDAKVLAEETAKAAKISGLSVADTVQYMTSAINGFNLTAQDASKVSDIFANLAARSATDFEDLAIAVSKVSAQANLAGMSIEYTTALLAKGIETTQEAPESIGTALKTIVARMRELSSYGSVLEDGATVNKVERALNAAGIELRTVTGEFRDLEAVFNELGPKWDYLNTMQQQAIAQAVAGTRQQSRFVAIMQDWARTQELIADANSSQGSAAEQYLKYSQGIEAALTRMKTSWEGFVQGLANNKIILTAINSIATVIETLNKIPNAIKGIIGLYAGLMVMHKARENHERKVMEYRQLEKADREQLAQSQQGILAKEVEENKLLEEKKKKLEAIKALIQAESAELKKQQQNAKSVYGSNTEIENLQQKGADKQNEIAQKQQEIRSSEDMLLYRDLTDEQKANWKKKLATQEAELNQLLQEQHDIELTIQTAVEKRDSQVSKLSNKEKEILDQYEQQREQVKQLQNDLEKLQTQKTAKTSELSSLDGSIDAMKNSEGFSPEDQEYTNLLAQQEQLKREIKAIDDQTLETQKELNSCAIMQEEGINKAIEGRRAQEASLENELTKKQYIMTLDEQAAHDRNTAEIQRLQLVQDRLELEKKALEIELKSLDKNSQAYKTKLKQLQDLDKAQTKNTKKLNKLGNTNQKLANGSLNIYSKMANLVGNKLGVNIEGIVNDMKTIGEFAKTLVTDFTKWLASATAQRQIEKKISDEKTEQVAAENAETTSATVNAGISAVQGKTEEKITDEKTDQVAAESTETGLQTANTLLSEKQVVTEKLSNKEKKKGIPLAISNAMAKIAEFMSNPVTAPFAIAGLAALAAVGIGAAGIAIAGSTGSSDKKAEGSIAKRGSANQEMLKQNREQQKNLDEYTALQNKAILTPEEQQRKEELESSMREMDEHFANLSGANLIAAVNGRIAAQEVAIRDNINKSFQEAVSMSDISNSAVAREAIANKMIRSQKDLIKSNVDLKDATEEDIAAIENTAATMAQNMAQEMDWNQFGTTKDLKWYDYAIATATAGWAGLAWAANTDQKAKEEARAMEAAVATFEQVSVEMATTMTLAEEDLASQVQAFDRGMENLTDALKDTSSSFQKTAQTIIKEQYSTISYVSELNQTTNGKLLDTISSIQRKTNGSVSTDALLKIADSIVGNNQATKGAANTIKNAESGSAGVNLASLRKDLGLSSDASMQEIQEAIVSKRLYKNSDGSLKIKKNGEYAAKGDNTYWTNAYNAISGLVEDLGDFASLSSGTIKALGDWNDSLEKIGKTLLTTFETIDQQLLSDQELLSKDLNDPSRITGSAGYAFTTAAYDAIAQIEKDGQERIKEYRALQSQFKEGSTEWLDLEEAIKKVNADMNTNSAQLLNSTREAIGYLSDSDWLNRSEALGSKRDNLQAIRDTITSGEELSTEQVMALYNDYFPDLKTLDSSLTTKQLDKWIQEGSPELLKLLTNYSDNYISVNAKSGENTIGHDLSTIEQYVKNDLLSKELGGIAQYDENGKLIVGSLDDFNWEGRIKELEEERQLDSTSKKRKEEIDKTIAAYKGIQSSIDDYYKHSSLQNASQLQLERESFWTAEELKLRNLEAKIAGLERDQNSDEIELLNLKIAANKDLIKTTKDAMGLREKDLDRLLAAENMALKDLVKIENGQVIVIEEAWNGLSDDLKSVLKEQIEAYAEAVEKHADAVQQDIDLEKEKLDAIISLQDEYIEAYKNTLEKEQEEVQGVLDKRKELYQQYFDWLNDQDSEEDREEQMEILQKRIANLATGTDATSRKLLQEAQEELANLQKESVKDRQQKIQEQILANLDKQSTAVEEYYNKQLEDNNTIISLLSAMAPDQLLEMFRKQNDYYNQTKEKQEQLDKEFEKKLGARLQLPGFSKGGLVNYTGLAQVHGTPSQPEAFLNAEQTALFAQLSEALVRNRSRSVASLLGDPLPPVDGAITNNLTIENFEINISADMSNAEGVYTTGQSLADVFFERIQASGIPVNLKK